MNGKELRVFRKRRGLTQAQLAKLLKITPEYVGMMERGSREIQPHMAQGIRAVVGDGINPDDHKSNGKVIREAKAALLFAIRRVPTLTANGFPFSDVPKVDEFSRLKAEQMSRAALLDDDGVEQVATAIAWIDTLKVTRDLLVGSYAAKHRAEEWGQENGYVSYVSNGALIVAAIYRNVPFERVPDSPNARLGLDVEPLPEAKRGSFTAWLRQQTDRPGPVGDLARDAVQDTTFPVHTSSNLKLRSYLYSKNACDGALVALDKAHKIWRSEAKH